MWQVTNLSPSVAISMNYVDASNIDKALNETRLEGLVDDESRAVHRRLAAVRDARQASEATDALEGQDLPWLAFKTRSLS